MKRKKAGKIKELPDIVAVDNLSTRSKGEAEAWKFWQAAGNPLWKGRLVRYTGERKIDRKARLVRECRKGG